MDSKPSSQFDPYLISKYNVSGPRYTSYPTALQFTEQSGFGDPELSSIISNSPWANRDISLYLHLPFCAKLCYYCACNKVVTKKYDKVPTYLAALEQEIQLYAPHLYSRKVSQLHWGGGTPTFLNNQDIHWLMDTLRGQFQFASDSEGEYGIEIDPRTVDPERIDELRSAGFNRLSMGIQDFDPTVQKAVNRVQSVDETRAIVERARQRDFRSISVDLIYGLPFQSEESFSRTLDTVVDINPDRISVFNYAHLPDRFPPQQRILVSDLPQASEKLAILQRCTEVLINAGYVYIGMDHFARPTDELAIAQQEGTLHRNFQGYSTFAEADMFAFGVTAISHIGHSYWQNSKDLATYEALLEDRMLPLERGVSIDKDDQIRGAIIQALICQFKVNYAAFDLAYDISTAVYFADELKRLESFQVDGLLEINQQGIKITNSGRFLVRNICMVFDRYLPANGSGSESRFSKAV